jgi:hypothetical protein
MEVIIFYTELDKIIGCTQDKSIKEEPFCDECLEKSGSCYYKNKFAEDIQQKFQNERQLRASFIRL